MANTTNETKKKAAAAGVKTPSDYKKAASPKLKAMRAEAAEGDVVVEFEGEFYTVHVRRYEQRLADDYEFMEVASKGAIALMLDELLDKEDIDKLKNSIRDEDTGRVKTERMVEKFEQLMEAVGQGN